MVDETDRALFGVLTLVSAILLPITVIAGTYGMNFEYMPELGYRPAYFLVLGSCAVIITAMALWFRHRGWIGRAAEREAERRRRTLITTVLEVPVLRRVLKVPLSGVRAVARTGRGVSSRR